MTDDESTAWQAYQEERRKQREERAAKDREYHIRHSLETLAKYGHPAPGDVDKLKVEHEAMKTAHQAAQDELAGLRLAVDHDWQLAQIGELTQGIRDRDHFDRFRELAAKAKMHPRAIKRMWDTSGFKAESEKVDEEALGKLLDGMRREHDYAFVREPATPPADQPAARESEPAAAAGSGPRFVFSRGQWKSNGSAPPGVP